MAFNYRQAIVQSFDDLANAIRTIGASGAATSANQATEIADLVSINTAQTDGSQKTQVTSLPTGLSTSAKQDTGNSSLSSIDTKLTTQATASKQDTGNTSLASIDTKLSSARPLNFKTRADNFINTGNGTIVNCTTSPVKYFAIQVKAVGTITAWDVRLEGSLDGSNFSQILQHQNTTGDGVVLWGSSPAPSLYMRARCAGLTLGLGTEIDVTILGSE